MPLANQATPADLEEFRQLEPKPGGVAAALPPQSLHPRGAHPQGIGDGGMAVVRHPERGGEPVNEPDRQVVDFDHPQTL